MNIFYKKIKLGDLGKIITGKTPSTKNLDYYNSPSIPFITPTDYEEGTRFVKTSRYLSDIARIKFSSNLLPQESIMVTCIGSQMGKVGLNGEECITNQQINSIIPDKQKVDTDYLYYLLLKMESILRRLGEGGGSTMPIINKTDFSNLEISLPPLSSQHRIANILSSFDNKIEQLKKENNILEDIAQNIFKEWFVKYNFPNKDGKPYKDNKGKMIDSELGEIPEGWRVGKLGEITSITSGKSLPKKDLAKRGEYEVLGANGKIGETNKYLFDKQLIFTGRVGTLGNIFLSNKPAWYSDNTLLIFPKDNFLYYVYRYLQRQRLEKLDRGSTQPLITQTDLKSILLNIPTTPLLSKFQEKSVSLNDKIDRNEVNIFNLERIKTSLLNKLINN